MMLFAAVGAVALGVYAEAAAVTFLFGVSEPLELEVRAAARVNAALAALMARRPKRAWARNPRTGEGVWVPVGAVAVGTRAVVRTGDNVQCDGVVVERRSMVDKSRCVFAVGSPLAAAEVCSLPNGARARLYRSV
jgi:Cd2+/Zn2+-exporting ATPase